MFSQLCNHHYLILVRPVVFCYIFYTFNNGDVLFRICWLLLLSYLYMYSSLFQIPKQLVRCCCANNSKQNWNAIEDLWNSFALVEFMPRYVHYLQQCVVYYGTVKTRNSLCNRGTSRESCSSSCIANSSEFCRNWVCSIMRVCLMECFPEMGVYLIFKWG